MKITLKEYSCSSKPTFKWRVRFPKNGKSAEKLFKTKKEADEFIRVKNKEIQKYGSQVSERINSRSLWEISELIEKLDKKGKTINEAVGFYLDYLEYSEKSAKVEDLIPEFLYHKRKNGKSRRYQQELSNRLKFFSKKFGSNLACNITSKALTHWLNELAVSNLTRNHYRRVASAFFAWCLAQGYVSKNPVEMVQKSKSDSGETEIYTPEEMMVILRASASVSDHDKDLLSFMLLGAFAGLRSSEIERLEWEDVKLGRGLIDLSGIKTKTAQRRIIKIQDVLFDWLKEYFAFSTGKVMKPNHVKRMRLFKNALKKKQNFEWKHNALRHSYASYLMAKTNDAAFVSLQLGHNNSGVVFRHYRELVTEEDSKVYWGLSVKEVLNGGKERIA